MKASNLELGESTNFVFMRLALMVSKIECQLLHHLDKTLEKLMVERVICKLSRKNFRWVLIDVIELIIEMGLSDLEGSAMLRPLELIIKEIDLMRVDFKYSENINFILDCEFLKKCYNYLQIIITLSEKSKECPLPKNLLESLIKLEYSFYPHLIDQNLKLNEQFEDLILLSLSFFHTFSLHYGGRFQLSLFQQRQPYLDG